MVCLINWSPTFKRSQIKVSLKCNGWIKIVQQRSLLQIATSSFVKRCQLYFVVSNLSNEWLTLYNIILRIARNFLETRTTHSCKVIREKSRGGRFLWNKNWDLGWIWAGSATFEAGFFMFSWAKKILKNILDGENIFGIEWN